MGNVVAERLTAGGERSRRGAATEGEAAEWSVALASGAVETSAAVPPALDSLMLSCHSAAVGVVCVTSEEQQVME